MGAGSITLIVSGLIVTGLFSFLGFGGLEMVIRMAVGQMLQLKEGTDIWHVWSTIPLPIYMKFRLFNITNPDGLANGDKANVVEMGPYVYVEDWEKVNISVNEETDSISYVQTKVFNFVPEMSKGTPNDQVTFINVIFLSVAAVSYEFADDDFMLTSLDEMLSGRGERIVRTASVREVIFDGFSIQTYIDMFNDDLVKAAVEAAGKELEIPENIADGKFALLKHKNGSGDGVFVVRSGKSGPADLGKVISWEGKTVMKSWRGTVEDGCNRINGTDGTLFPPFMTRESKPQVFNPQVCRSLTFDYRQDSSALGISTYQFELSPTTFLPPDDHPPNWCFCPVLKNETGSCARRGVLDLRSCVGAPMLLSRPHFLETDEWIQNGVNGLNPDPDDHRTVLEFHPLTGTPVIGKVRLQFNIELVQYEAMPSFADVQNAIIPFLWIEEIVELDDHNHGMLVMVDGIQSGFVYARFVFIGLGLLLIVVGVILKVKGKKTSSAKVKAAGPDIK